MRIYQTEWAAGRRRAVREALAASAGERILDMGCGPGFYCSELAEDVGLSGCVFGVDLSPANIAVAVRRCAGQANVEFRVGEASSLPMEDSSVDAAISVQVLEYVADVPAALSELRRVLRPGGRVVVWDVDWATVSWHSAEPERMVRVLAAWDQHLAHRSVPRALGPALQAAGFVEVAARAHPMLVTGSQPELDYGLAITPLLTSFVSGRGGVSEAEARAWADEQEDLRERGEYYFACLQACFTATLSDAEPANEVQRRGG